jgi:hypothetical protein
MNKTLGIILIAPGLFGLVLGRFYVYDKGESWLSGLFGRLNFLCGRSGLHRRWL